MQPADREAISRLIFHSTNQYYESIGREPIFQGEELDPAIMFDVYQTLDPNQGLVAVDNKTDGIIGLCFVHPRETHFSLGIMNVHPDHFGRGVARTLLSRIIEMAMTENKPVRLVSSCLNLDSYSLYTRAGFIPFCTFQDMFLEVPENGLTFDPPNDLIVRPGRLDDVEGMVAIEREVAGITRRNDYDYFLRNDKGFWHVSVVESNGQLDGFLISCGSQASNMLGPGVARTEDQAIALIYAELNQHAGHTPVFLVPVNCGELVQQLYKWGARNCEMHVAQSYGLAQQPAGIIMPTFLPESG